MSLTLPDLRLLHGSEEPVQAPRRLRAGPLCAWLDGVDLRYVRLGETELVRRIYVAVRDRNWNTIPGIASDIELDERDDTFEVRFTVRHASHDTDFSWRGTISGAPEGQITLRMDGRAGRDMLYNRIGFCVLHPFREYAGAPFRGETPSGPVEGTFPDAVAPQRLENGVYGPLFASVSRLSVTLTGGAQASFEFDGDLFETEDQRNWTDASFKTYSTPAALGVPHRLEAGESKAQAVIVHTSAGARSSAAPPQGVRSSVPALRVGRPTGRAVPGVGLALPPGAAALSAVEAGLLRGLGPAHLRASLHLGEADWPRELAGALRSAEELGAGIELAVFVGGDADGALAQLRERLTDQNVVRILVAAEGVQNASPEETTPAALVARVRDALGLAGVPVAGGTDMNFCELNRTRPAVADMDGVFWSLNAQVHAFDDLSLLETPEAQGEQVRTARGFARGSALFVGPVTLRRRYNVYATVTEEDGGGELPDSVDPRQAALIAAAWTLASAKHLAEQGADSITYFETVGWGGVIQGDADPPAPEAFPARAGQAFPLYHVLADVAELRGSEIVECRSDHPLDVAGLAARRGGGELSLLLANLTPRPLTVGLTGVPPRGRLRRLNLETAEQAMSQPEAFRAHGHASADLGELALGPYETVRISVEN